jgi:hypothetical protein
LAGLASVPGGLQILNRDSFTGPWLPLLCVPWGHPLRQPLDLYVSELLMIGSGSENCGNSHLPAETLRRLVPLAGRSEHGNGGDLWFLSGLLVIEADYRL